MIYFLLTEILKRYIMRSFSKIIITKQISDNIYRVKYILLWNSFGIYLYKNRNFFILNLINVSYRRSRMKKNLILLLFIFPILVSAQVQWQNGGVPVRLGDNINYDFFMTSQDDNTFVNVWSDTRNGIRGIFAQKVDSSGNKLWDENDVEIFNPDRRQIISNTISTSDNCTIICWTDYIQEDDSLDQCRIQKVDADGNKLWGAVGIVLQSCEAYYSDCHLVPHSDSGFYIFWRNNIEQMIEGARILPDGSIAEGWYPGFDILGTNGYYHVSSDMEDGVVLSSIAGNDIYIQRVNENGNLLWGSLGTLVQNGGAVYQTEISTAQPGSYYCTWRKEFTTDDNELLISRIDENGEPTWDSHLEIPTESLFHEFNSGCIDSSLVLSIHNFENITAHKINSDGELLWGDDGVSIVGSNSETISISSSLQVDNLGNSLLTWSEEVGSGNSYNYKLQKISSEGDILFGDSGLEVFPTQIGSSKNCLTLSEQNYYLIRIERLEQSEPVIQEILDHNGNSVLDSENMVLKENLTGSCGYFTEIMENGDNPILVWIDKRSKNIDRIFMQTLDSDGNALLAENGIPITPYEPYNQWEVDTAGNTSNGLFAFSWTECKDDFCKIYTQAVDEFGNRIWADSSVCVSAPNWHSSDSKISFYDNDGIDEYYIGWQNYNISYRFDLRAQKIIDGVSQWDDNGIVISEQDTNVHLFDVNENFFIWGDETWPNLDLRITLIQPDGNLSEGWPVNGLVVLDAIEYDDYVKSSITPEGLLVTWTVSGVNNKVIYGQLIDYNGNKLWGENGKILVPTTTNSYYDIVVDEHVYIAWDEASSSTQMNYFIQKYDLSGNAQWDEDGMQLTSYTEENHWAQHLELSLIEDGVVGVLQYHCPEGITRIDAVHINSEGELFPYDTPIEICDVYKYQSTPQVCTSGNNAYISWLDSRSTVDSNYGLIFEFGIYAQKLTIDTSSGNNETIPVATTQLKNNYPNPFNPSTSIQFAIPADSEVELSIFNVKGQKIQTLCNDELEKGEHNFIWNGKDKSQNPVSSGVYLYKLKTNSKSITKRMVLLK